MQDGSKVPVSRLRKDGLLKALLGAGWGKKAARRRNKKCWY
jgi:hypothetical protein